MGVGTRRSGASSGGSRAALAAITGLVLLTLSGCTITIDMESEQHTADWFWNRMEAYAMVDAHQSLIAEAVEDGHLGKARQGFEVADKRLRLFRADVEDERLSRLLYANLRERQRVLATALDATRPMERVALKARFIELESKGDELIEEGPYNDLNGLSDGAAYIEERIGRYRRAFAPRYEPGTPWPKPKLGA